MAYINDSLVYDNARFIRTICNMPVGALLKMEKTHLLRSLARARLVCQWLEGTLKLVNELEQKGK